MMRDKFWNFPLMGSFSKSLLQLVQLRKNMTKNIGYRYARCERKPATTWESVHYAESASDQMPYGQYDNSNKCTVTAINAL
jgi:hypothetical protein